MREIITLQLGQQSNYLGSHFWNTQESYFTYGQDGESPVDHDVHFRPGLGADGTETYMPRTVIYDLKGGFGSLRKINALYDATEDGVPQGLWNGRTVVQREQPIEPSAYQESLDTGDAPPELTTSTVRYWSDFNRVFFHPRSIVQLNEFELNSTVMPFEKWHSGEELFASLDKDHDILDRDLRPFVEEADQMQGVQVMTGIDDAWGGFASKYMERLRDEYGKTPIMVWGLQEPTVGTSREKRLLRLVNKARAITDLYAQASLLVPLAIPSVSSSRSVALDRSSPWHVSALFNAAIESTSLYTRLKTSDRTNSTSLGHMTDILNVFGKQTIVNLQISPISPPKPVQNGTNGAVDAPSGRGELVGRPHELEYEDQPDANAQNDLTTLDVDLSSLDETLGQSGARSRRKPHLFSQVSTSRGFEPAQPSDEVDSDTPRYGGFNRPKTYQYESPLAFPMLDSYPRIFRDGDSHVIQNQIRVKTVLSTDSSVMDKMKGLRTTVARSIGLEDRETIGNELAEIAEGYKEGWSSGSDDDDDE
ncbi:tubulin domain-containing protein [Pseudomassariella vexata]|uniref:Tubulin domain-domain-containing protein n=1 Tax=Pseudomassariella vexata TaxID=1141098 RepID=A0A1Y2EEI0_9PEZI|nr:tubulin domain-containing protein [Pseudomassariella vexata]ORY69817.1 tubulin domain-domain-containing protein [Pseudomassariella vexata]